MLILQILNLQISPPLAFLPAVCNLVEEITGLDRSDTLVASTEEITGLDWPDTWFSSTEEITGLDRPDTWFASAEGFSGLHSSFYIGGETYYPPFWWNCRALPLLSRPHEPGSVWMIGGISEVWTGQNGFSSPDIWSWAAECQCF